MGTHAAKRAGGELGAGREACRAAGRSRAGEDHCRGLAPAVGASRAPRFAAPLGGATPAPGTAVPGAEARADVQAPLAASLDETGGREGRPRAWWWTAGTAGVTVCVRRVSRGGNVARALVGERCWGGWVTERWSADPG
jgi:hypothetical protein